MVDTLLPSLVALSLRHTVEPTEGSSKRKVDGTLANTRLGSVVTPRWLNERFRQTMLLIREFKVNWHTGTLLSADDLQFVRLCLDVALAQAEREQHIGDIYDMNPTVWACWLVQHVLASRSGKWEVESLEQRLLWSFTSLYLFLEAMHSRGDTLRVRDLTAGELLRRYKLPFKRMTIPPKPAELFKWRKGAKRLSDWLEAGGLAPLHPGIIAQQPPTIVAPPPMAAQREARRAALWSRVAQRASQRPLVSVRGDEADVRETRAVVEGVLGSGGLSIEQVEAELLGGGRAAAAAGPSESMADEDELEVELGRELTAQQQQQQDDSGEEGIPVRAERVGPPLPEDDAGQRLWPINELLGEIRGAE